MNSARTITCCLGSAAFTSLWWAAALGWAKPEGFTASPLLIPAGILTFILVILCICWIGDNWDSK